jgi:hypothetical protein
MLADQLPAGLCSCVQLAAAGTPRSQAAHSSTSGRPDVATTAQDGVGSGAAPPAYNRSSPLDIRKAQLRPALIDLTSERPVLLRGSGKNAATATPPAYNRQPPGRASPYTTHAIGARWLVLLLRWGLMTQWWRDAGGRDGMRRT